MTVPIDQVQKFLVQQGNRGCSRRHGPNSGAAQRNPGFCRRNSQCQSRPGHHCRLFQAPSKHLSVCTGRRRPGPIDFVPPELLRANAARRSSGRTGGLPKNVHIMVKIDRANNARPSCASPCPGQPGIRRFLKSGMAIANNIANKFDPAGQLSVRIREHISLIGRQTIGNH